MASSEIQYVPNVGADQDSRHREKDSQQAGEDACVERPRADLLNVPLDLVDGRKLVSDGLVQLDSGLRLESPEQRRGPRLEPRKLLCFLVDEAPVQAAERK